MRGSCVRESEGECMEQQGVGYGGACRKRQRRGSDGGVYFLMNNISEAEKCFNNFIFCGSSTVSTKHLLHVIQHVIN